VTDECFLGQKSIVGSRNVQERKAPSRHCPVGVQGIGFMVFEAPLPVIDCLIVENGMVRMKGLGVDIFVEVWTVRDL